MPVEFVGKVEASKKKVVVFCLEDILIPGKTVANLDMKKVRTWLGALTKYAKEHLDFHIFVISGATEEVAWKKIREHELESFLDAKNVFAVTPAYLDQMTEVDRKLYEGKVAQDPEYVDEYFRQVQIKSLMEKEGFTQDQILLIGHDYWFDGFYTRRFSGVDTAFIGSALTQRGKPVTEKIEGLWYIERDWKALKKIIEGKVEAPNYARLDAWVTVTLTEELLGAKGVPQLRRVILERKKDGGFENVQKF